MQHTNGPLHSAMLDPFQNFKLWVSCWDGNSAWCFQPKQCLNGIVVLERFSQTAWISRSCNATSQVLMSGISLGVSHGACCAVGLLIGCWLNSGPRETKCPDCVVTLSCPPVSCTTGSIEISATAVFFSIIFSVIVYLTYWFYRLRFGQSPSVGIGKGVSVNGRKGPLGASSSWRPITG